MDHSLISQRKALSFTATSLAEPSPSFVMKLMNGSSVDRTEFLTKSFDQRKFHMQRDLELGSIEIWYKKKLWQKLLMSDNNNKID